MSQSSPGPTISLTAAAAIAVGELFGINSSGQAVLATASIKPIAVCTFPADPATSSTEVTGKLLHAGGTFDVKAGAAIAVGAQCWGAAAGELTTVPTPTARFRAKTAAAADNDRFEAIFEGFEENAAIVGTPSTATAGATLTTAQLAAARDPGLLRATHPGGGATATLTLPLAADMDTAFPDIPIGGGFRFTIKNIGTAAAADTYTIATNTGWTVTGNVLTVPSGHATTGALAGGNCATFLASKTGAGAWTLDRVG